MESVFLELRCNEYPRRLTNNLLPLVGTIIMNPNIKALKSRGFILIMGLHYPTVTEWALLVMKPRATFYRFYCRFLKLTMQT